ncbi:MAG: NAD(P)-dependent oxidoreductase [Thermodesulfobacteriota bacterium]
MRNTSLKFKNGGSEYVAELSELRPLNLGRRELSLMKPTSILINIGRGEVINQDALTEFLVKKRIGGAGLDVFDQEPVPKDSPLLKLDNVVFTPHVGGSTQEALAKNMKQACNNVRSVANGKPFLNAAY